MTPPPLPPEVPPAPESIPKKHHQFINGYSCSTPLSGGAGTSSSGRAMTLVEILAVVVILGLLAGTLLMGFSGSFGKAKQELAKTGIGQIVSKLELYRIDQDTWPSNELGLTALSDGHTLPTVSFYLSPDKLLDPWGNSFLYVEPGPDGHPYEVICYGGDGQPGGEGENADLSSVNLRAND